MSVFCRLCRIQIFSLPTAISNNSIRHNKPIQEMIFECTRIMLVKDTRLPQFLCDSCTVRLDETYAFILLCRESEEIFLKLFPQPKHHTDITTHPPKSADQQTKGQELNRHNNTTSIKLELVPEVLSVPVEYSNSFDILPGIENESRKGNNKDWISEARLHRERQRISTAKRRAKMSAEQREKERERARHRQAQRRANRTDEEIRAQRERDRIRQAMKRAKFREVEMMDQHPLNHGSPLHGLSLLGLTQK
ncbi:uncharacterized protein LOC131682693 [Topomyia yanbarensis]|uniref:uncharacterized protein LOC131682693 n=1 Tax=Topomyia yanbarensis TaxID=2498891 RepID=UPI00273B5F4B|nr:uncharacterized protein LOC131682693 [Topomyia yanbarensis]